jgi:hypothetical protein
MPKGNEKCAHGPCQCAAEENSKYCSEYCEDAEDTGVTELMCGCAHAACHG